MFVPYYPFLVILASLQIYNSFCVESTAFELLYETADLEVCDIVFDYRTIVEGISKIWINIRCLWYNLSMVFVLTQ